MASWSHAAQNEGTIPMCEIERISDKPAGRAVTESCFFQWFRVGAPVRGAIRLALGLDGWGP
jgi:hypothetical protein